MVLFFEDFFPYDDYQEELLDVKLELIEDDYLKQYIVADYQNQRLLKEK